MMLKFHYFSVEKGNQAFQKTARSEKTLESIMKKWEPEAAYFGPSDGNAQWNDISDLAEPSQIVDIVEPLFSKLNAAVEIIPTCRRTETICVRALAEGRWKMTRAATRGLK